MKALSLIAAAVALAALPAISAPKPAAKATEPTAPATAPAAPPASAAAVPFSRLAAEVTPTGFTHKNKDGAIVTFTVPEGTPITRAKAPAKWADVKPGDTINGLATKQSPTAWTVLKITNFGPDLGKKKTK